MLEKTPPSTKAPRTLTEEQMSLPLETPAPVVVDWRTKVPTVSQITRNLRGHIENSFFDVWVRGEISNFRKPVSGHAYFILKDSAAQLRACMFKPQLSKVKFQVQDGMEVLIHGKITIYEARGDYQILGDAIEPVGVGALQLAFEQLKQKLQKEGLFDKARKKNLPFLPKTVGVVTSATGAAVRDILKVISRRFPHVRVLILPAAVQGEKAAPDIVQAIKNAELWNQQQPKSPIEVLIVGRGGGSLEDLWPFNEEIVARAIHACPIPIISAVGHEIDFTIADFVADLRAPTPSAAAEIVLPKLEELEFQVQSRLLTLQRMFKKKVEQYKLHLGHLGQRLVDPRTKIRLLKKNLESLSAKLFQSFRMQKVLRAQKVSALIHRLNALSPLAVLSRGYSLTRKPSGEVVRSVTEVKSGDILRILVADGEIESQTLSLVPKDR